MKAKIKNSIILIVFSVLAGGLVFMLATPLDSATPPLGDLLLPGSGIWSVPKRYPAERSFDLPGLNGTVSVFRDQWGIPHIYAENTDDTAFAMGYTQAEDRLFFMDLARRFARGRLAEVLGPDLLSQDKLAKTKLLEYYAQKTIEHLERSDDPGDRSFYNYICAYRDGVNHYLTSNSGSLPLEFHLLNYGFEPWTNVDSLAIGYFMIEGGSWGYWDIDRFLVMTRFVEHWGQKLGREKFIELFGNPGEGKVLPHQIPISPDYGHFAQTDPPQEPTERTAHKSGPDASGALAMHGLFSTFMDTLTDMPHESRKLADLDFVGSNSWVVHGSRTTSGKPLSCSDSHENFDLPNIYYETHVVDASTGHNFYGYVVAGGGGIPVYGHTQYLSYGMTRCHWDQIDWYYYTTAGEDAYIYNGEARQFEPPVIVDIRVKGQPSVRFDVKRTVHGPVFFGPQTNLGRPFKTPPESLKDKIVAAQWIHHKITDLGPALLGMSRAESLAEFQQHLARFEGPPSHVTYADRDGNIGVFSMGYFAVRNNKGLPAWHLGNGTLPYDGSTGQGEWERIVGFEELSKSINPDTGFLVGSNQIAAGPDYFTRYPAQFRYNAGYRARRMNELLNTKEQLSVDDMQAFQTDTLSILARDFTPHLITLIQHRDKDKHMDSVLKLMSTWDYRMDMASPAPSILAVWTAFLAEEVFGDEWKMLGLNRRVFPQEPILEALLRTQADAVWFDNISTPDKTETARDAMNNAWENTLNSLAAFFKTDDIEKWQWGALHQLEFRHMTGELDALNFGPVPVSGSGHTIAAPRNTLLKDGQLEPTHAHHGAHHRMVTDFGNMQKSVSVLPGGNSGLHTLGEPFGQFHAYLRGNYHNEYFTADTPQKFADSCESIVSKITFSREGGK